MSDLSELRKAERRAAALAARKTRVTVTIAAEELALLQRVKLLAAAYAAAPDVQDLSKLRAALKALRDYDEENA